MPFIYRPQRQFMSPNEKVIDPADSNVFSLVIDGQTCTAYEFYVYTMQNDLVGGAGSGFVILPEVLYNGDTLAHTLPAGSLEPGNTYKWQVNLFTNHMVVTSVDTISNTILVANHNLSTGDTIFVTSSDSLPSPLVWNKVYYVRRLDRDTLALFEYIEGARNDAGRVDITGAGAGTISIYNVAQSEQVVFSAYNDPVVAFPPEQINTPVHTFRPIYSHPQGVIVNNFEAIMASSVSESRQSSGVIYRSRMEYTFDGLLNGETYWVKFIIVTNVGQRYDTGFIPFEVSYNAPDLGMTPSAVSDYLSASVSINWPGIVQIPGHLVGDYEFINGYSTPENMALHLRDGSVLMFENLNALPGSSPPVFFWTPWTRDFVGPIRKSQNSLTGDYTEVGYNGSNFYRNINGVIYNTAPITIDPSLCFMIGETEEFLVVNTVGGSNIVGGG